MGYVVLDTPYKAYTFFCSMSKRKSWDHRAMIAPIKACTEKLIGYFKLRGIITCSSLPLRDICKQEKTQKKL